MSKKHGINAGPLIKTRRHGKEHIIMQHAAHQIDHGRAVPRLAEWKNKNAVHVYSTTVLNKYQGRGYGKKLKEFSLAYIDRKYDFILGHAKDEASIEINKKFGAEVIGEYENWQGSGETYFFYKIERSVI